MQLLRHTDNDALSCYAFERIIYALHQKPDLVLCAASGSSPVLTYQYLADYARNNPAFFRQIRVVQLDEFLVPGLATGRGETYMNDNILGPLRVTPDRYLGFDSSADPEIEAARMNAQLGAWGGLDMAVLGLGLNGHLGMIEPAEELTPEAHVAALHLSTQQHTMVQDLQERPQAGVTLGIGDMLQAREVLLIVNGEHKREALRQLLTRRVSTKFPASLLWLHPNAWLLADEPALGGG